MKKHFLSVVLALFILTSASAQDLQFGISGGVDAARLSIFGASGGPLKYKSELGGGLSLEAALSSTFGLQLEANYAQLGTGVIAQDGSSAGSYQLDYITIPIVIKLYGSARLSFFAGPQVGILLSAKSRSSTQDEIDIKDQLKKTDIYAVFGAEYKFTNGIFVNARYNIGMTNLVDEDVSPDQELKTRYFNFRIGYAFKL
jgi:hypothetical protein